MTDREHTAENEGKFSKRKIVKTVFFWCTISIFFEIVLTVLSDKCRIYFEKYRNRYSDLSRTDAPYQGKDNSNGNISFYDNYYYVAYGYHKFYRFEEKMAIFNQALFSRSDWFCLTCHDD